jgi:hypothetical protein
MVTVFCPWAYGENRTLSSNSHPLDNLQLLQVEDFSEFGKGNKLGAGNRRVYPL